MKIEVAGIRDKEDGCLLYVNGHKVIHQVKHSPTGMEWGYSGSGPADTARSILMMVLPGNKVTNMLYQQFKWDFVAKWQGDKIKEIIDLGQWLKKQKQGPNCV